MGQVIFDERERPLMRMTYQGVPDEEEWERHIATMSDWARRGEVYGVVIDAREVGRIPATQRRGIMDWITRDKAHLRANCAGGALIFASPLQQGLWTAISWVTHRRTEWSRHCEHSTHYGAFLGCCPVSPHAGDPGTCRGCGDSSEVWGWRLAGVALR